MATEQTEFTFPDEQEDKKSVHRAEAAEIEIVDDTPPEDRGRSPMKEPPADPTQEELEGYSESVRTRIKHFTKGYHEERRAKEAAIREKEEAFRIANAAVQENQRLQGSLSQNQSALVEQAKLALTAQAEAAKKKLKEAMEAFDADAQIEATQELTSANAKLEQIHNFRPAPVQTPKPVVQTPQTQQLDPKLQAWTEKNTWFGEDEEATGYALALHQKLLKEGVANGSDEYYRRIDASMQKRFPDVVGVGDDDGAGAPPPRARTNIVAPATRSTAPRKIVLTSTQVSLAKRLGVPLEAYAKQVAAEMSRSR